MDNINNLIMFREGKNALQEVTATIFLSKPIIDIKQFERLKDLEDKPYFKNMLKIQSVTGRVEFNGEESKATHEVGDDCGFIFSDQLLERGNRGESKWVIIYNNEIIHKKTIISISCFFYENWSNYIETVIDILIDFIDIDKSLSIDFEAIGLKFVNEFRWKPNNDKNAYPVYSDYINFDSEFIPKALKKAQDNFQSTLVFHSFMKEKELNHFLNISFFRILINEFCFIIDNQYVLKLNNINNLNHESIHNILISNLEEEHLLNNKLISDILKKDVWKNFVNFKVLP